MIHFKRNFIFIATALIFFACAEDLKETVPSSSDFSRGSEAIGFDATTADTISGSPYLTRTAVGTMTDATLQTGGFGVFAAHTGLHPYASSDISTNFMYNQKVTYNSTASAWTYSPVKYWPNGIDDAGNKEYISFFAYAPYAVSPGVGADNASQCITDISMPYDSGDPWLIYQLGGTRDEFTGKQVDLLYAFSKDQQRSDAVSTKVALQFRHALAGAGDVITVTCSDALQTALKSLYVSSPVRLTLTQLVLNYQLTRKGKLVLNNASTPNWKPVESDDPLVHRVVTLTPNQVIATATAADACTLTDYTSEDLGIFYLPLQVGEEEQLVDVTASYSVSTGFTGTVGTTIYLGTITDPQKNNNFTLTLTGNTPLSGNSSVNVGMTILDIDEQTYTGSALTPSVIVKDAGGRVLTAGADYTLEYANNINAATSTADVAPVVTATGIGDHQGKMATKTFTIRKAKGEVYFGTTGVDLSIGGTYTNPTLTNTAGGDYGSLTYTSSNPSVATVDASSGLVTALAAGEATITATVTDGSNYHFTVPKASYVVHVGKQAAAITLAISSASVVYGEASPTLTLTNRISGTTSNADGAVLYKSSNHEVATVNPTTGAITIANVGSTVITAEVTDGSKNSYASKSAAVTLTVTKRPVKVTALAQTKTYSGNSNVFQGTSFAALTDNYGSNAGNALTGSLSGQVLSAVTLRSNYIKQGVYANAIDASVAHISTADHIDMTHNYSITYVPGQLTITGAREIADTDDSYLGNIIGSDGKVYYNCQDAELAGITPVAMICYVGVGDYHDGDADGNYDYPHGLAMALDNVGSASSAFQFCTAGSCGCSIHNINDGNQPYATIANNLWGIDNTAALYATHQTYASTGSGHGHPGVNAAVNFSPSTPANTSGWFVPSEGQWVVTLVTYGASESTIASERYPHLVNGGIGERALNAAILAAGGQEWYQYLGGFGYMSSTSSKWRNTCWDLEASWQGANHAHIRMDVVTTESRKVRPFLAF